MMITMLTGVSQAGRRPRWEAGAPPWDPSAEVLASVSLTAGLSLDLAHLRSRTARSPTSDAGRSPAGAEEAAIARLKRIVPARTGEAADCRVTWQSSPMKTYRLGRWPASLPPNGPRAARAPAPPGRARERR